MLYMFNMSIKEKKHENGIYKIAIGKDANKVIDVKDASKANNATVDIWDYKDEAHQKYNLEYQKEGFYKITALHTGKSLTAKDNNIKEGTSIIQNDYQGLDSQKWALRDSDKNGWIISPLSNPLLAISVEKTIKNGEKLILSKTLDNDNQMWYMFDITQEEKKYEINPNEYKHTSGIYRLAVGKDASKVIEVKSGETANNAIVDIWTYKGNAEQKFYLEYQKEGFYKIIALHSGKSLTVQNGAIEKGANIVQYDYQGLDSQKWYLRDSKKNGWIISPFGNTRLAISIEKNITNGEKLILGKAKDNDNQMLYIFNMNIKEQKHKNGIYKIAIGRDANKVIEVKDGDKANNGIVDIWDYKDESHQKYNLEYQKEGFYKRTAVHTGKS